MRTDMDNGGNGSTAVLNKKVGPLTVKLIIAMIVSAAIGVFILCIGGLAGNFIGWILVAILVYMIPHLAKADVKIKAVWGAVFAVIAISIGGALVGPAYVSGVSVSDLSDFDNEYFEDVVYVVNDDGTITVTAIVNGVDADNVPVLAYTEVSLVTFQNVYVSNTVSGMDKIAMTQVSGSTYTATIDTNNPASNFDTSNLYYMFLSLAKYEDSSYVVNQDKVSTVTLSGWDFDGSVYTYTVYGAAYSMMYTMVIYYLILLFSYFFRRKVGNTRKKMEDSGRLYPQGYGRCTFCGAIVLPGEVKCRKCGGYIDRPESIKPKKKDFFQCSECGAEVPSDASVCPKCGVKFDGVENEVVHADGKVDISTETFKCPKCGADVPKNADFCPECGKRFDE